MERKGVGVFVCEPSREQTGPGWTPSHQSVDRLRSIEA